LERVRLRVTYHRPRNLATHRDARTTQRSRIRLREMEVPRDPNTVRTVRIDHVVSRPRSHQDIRHSLGNPCEHRAIAAVYTILHRAFNHDRFADHEPSSSSGS